MANANSRLPLEMGSVFAGKYRLERILAEGGMGIVVAAFHIHLDQPVAIKFLRADYHGEGVDALGRFQREARAVAQLRGEHVAHVLDAGLTDSGIPYMAMEYLEGETLAGALQMRGPLDVSDAVEYAVQTCEGLAEAHARGIVHRDIKPYNLFLVERSPGWRAIKILDFGISKITTSRAVNIETNVILGSPCYMSPEQLRCTAGVDHRTDLWSLGATLYELLAGKAAFDASQSLPELVAAILERWPAPLRTLRPDVPPGVEAVIERCLAKDRGERFASAGQLALALLPFAPARARSVGERAASMTPAPSLDQALEAGNPWRTPPDEQGRGAQSPGLTPTAVTIPPNPETEERQPATTSFAGYWKTILRRHPMPLFAGHWKTILGTVALALGITALVRTTHPGEAPSETRLAAAAPPAVEQTAPPSAPVAIAANPAPNERIQLGVRAFPPVAQLTMDGKAVENPFLGSFPKDGSVHRIAASAWGYDAKSRDVSFSADTFLDMELERHIRTTLYPAPPVGTSKFSLGSAQAGADGSVPAGKNLKGLESESSSAGPDGRPASGIRDSDAVRSPGHAPARPIETKDPYTSP